MPSEELVQQVKDWQRKGKGHKLAWDRYVNESGSYKLDPWSKDDDFLQRFLDSTEMGMISTDYDEAEWQARNPGKGKGKGTVVERTDGEAAEALVDLVKDWQRQSPGHKLSWERFCRDNGTTKFDPKSKLDDFLQNFLDSAYAGSISTEYTEEELAASIARQQQNKDAKAGGSVKSIDEAWDPADGDLEVMRSYLAKGLAAITQRGKGMFGNGFVKLVELKGIGKGLQDYTSGGTGYDDRSRTGYGKGRQPPAKGKGKAADGPKGGGNGANIIYNERYSPY
eukprot:TRINITY_DN49070_c0_g1_i1.p1 TRINITY_DN49070_c0_g1~~TRINITY_DN49070_c0_g1_i1.p1  ORF type:complete len:281 (+),score=61.38 TRINITY_DN49070_c0_g1_i1:101-943(+)